MKIKFNFARLLENNRIILLLSLGIALVSWLMVGIYVDDRVSTSISNVPVQIDTTGTTPEQYGLSVIEGGKQNIRVRIEGVRAEIGNLSAEDIVVTPQLNGITEAGKQQVPIRVDIAKEGDFQIVDVPASIEVTFERLDSKELEVIAVADKIKAADGFRKDVVTASVKTLKLSGPSTELELVKQVRFLYDVSDTVETTIITDEIELQMLDELGNVLTKEQVEHVYYPDNDYTITVPVYMVRILPVQVEFINNVGKLDTEKLHYTLSQTELVVAGPKDIVETKEFVSIGPVDFSQLDLNSAQTLGVTLDAGLINEEDVQQITLYFGGGEYDTKTLNIDGGSRGNILMQGEPSDLSVQIQTAQLKGVKMVGAAADIRDLSAESLVARVDVSNVEEGSSLVRARVYVTGQSSAYADSDPYVWAVGEYYVQVKAVKRTNG